MQCKADKIDVEARSITQCLMDTDGQKQPGKSLLEAPYSFHVITFKKHTRLYSFAAHSGVAINIYLVYLN